MVDLINSKEEELDMSIISKQSSRDIGGIYDTWTSSASIPHLVCMRVFLLEMKCVLLQ